MVASSIRSLGNEAEFYDWAVKIELNSDKQIMLSNDNLASIDSPDSIIKTVETTVGLSELKDYDIFAFMDQIIAPQLKQMQEQEEARRQKRLIIYRRNPLLAQRDVVRQYPELAVKGSPLNNAYWARYKKYQSENKAFFTEPDWPLRLAKECKEDSNK